jgi:hypothetical protein
MIPTNANVASSIKKKNFCGNCGGGVENSNVEKKVTKLETIPEIINCSICGCVLHRRCIAGSFIPSFSLLGVSDVPLVKEDVNNTMEKLEDPLSLLVSEKDVEINIDVMKSVKDCVCNGCVYMYYSTHPLVSLQNETLMKDDDSNKIEKKKKKF